MAGVEVFVFFRESLLRWHVENARDLPWKETDDPYKIWLSEIILQQTQVAQGIPYYNRFINKYPTVYDLASASEAEVLKDWQGLGYNSRARNLRKAAITVCEDHEGYFPSTYDSLITLSGVGPYTAAAVASFAFGQQVPVIDANVMRILCRFLGIEENPLNKSVRTQLLSVLNEAMCGSDPAEFNQAIMNFGALQCIPKNPDCSACPLADVCFAYNASKVSEFPKSKIRKARKERYFHYLVLSSDQGVMMRRRANKDIWQGMHDFPLQELKNHTPMSQKQLRRWVISLGDFDEFELDSHAYDKQTLTHQKIHCVFYNCTVKKLHKAQPLSDIFFVGYINLHKFAVPKIIDCYFRLKSILL